MELKQIKDLMAAMKTTGTSELEIERENFKLVLKRADTPNGHSLPPHFYEHEDPTHRSEPTFHRRPAAATLSGKETHTLVHTDEKAAVDTTSLFVTSPMVGTYYSSPSPDQPAFVKVGDRVEKHTVVCIVEAMKVMNEVKSGVAGVVAEILVENSHPVEFGTKLYRITPQ